MWCDWNCWEKWKIVLSCMHLFPGLTNDVSLNISREQTMWCLEFPNIWSKNIKTWNHLFFLFVSTVKIRRGDIILVCWIWSCHHCFWKEWFVGTIFHTDFCCKWPLGCHGQIGPGFFRNFPQCWTCISIIIVFLPVLDTYQPTEFPAIDIWVIESCCSHIFHFVTFLVPSISNVLSNIVPQDFVLKGYVLPAVFNLTISHRCLGCRF